MVAIVTSHMPGSPVKVSVRPLTQRERLTADLDRLLPQLREAEAAYAALPCDDYCPFEPIPEGHRPVIARYLDLNARTERIRAALAQMDRMGEGEDL